MMRYLIGSLLLFSMLAFSEDAHAGANTGWCHVTEVSHQYDPWTLYFKLDCPVQNDGCSTPGSYVITDPNTTREDYNNKLPLVMAAVTTGKEIKLWLDGCSAGVPRARLVIIRP